MARGIDTGVLAGGLELPSKSSIKHSALTWIRFLQNHIDRESTVYQKKNWPDTVTAPLNIHKFPISHFAEQYYAWCTHTHTHTHTHTNLNRTLTAVKWTEKGVQKGAFALPLPLAQSNFYPIKSLMRWVTESLPLHHLATADINSIRHTMFSRKLPGSCWISHGREAKVFTLSPSERQLKGQISPSEVV